MALVDDASLDMLNTLRQELLALLALPTALVGYFVLLVIDVLFGIHGLLIPAVGACVIAASLLAYRLKATQPKLGAAVYLWGMVAAVSGLIWGSFAPMATAVLPALVLLAMAMLGVWPMIAVAGLGSAVIVGSAWYHRQLDGALLVPISVLVLTALVAWLSHRSLSTAVRWAWNSYRQARASTEEARQRRGELARTLKALDEAYYRLERFSAQLSAAREAAEEARRTKQQFVATVSHELRTPLNIIIGFAELMTLSPESYGVHGVPRQFMGDVNRIYRSAQHLKGLIDDVLDLSQIDARHMVLLTEQASLCEVTNEAVDMIWSLAAQKGLSLAVDVPDALPPVPLDRLRIRQVLLNLLTNAVRFTGQGQITVSARLLDGEIELTVADTGPGIAPQDLDRVFEEFHQLDSSLSRRHQGTGLGLALSRRFVELHGGRMWVESELSRGSCFHLTLPLTPPAPEQIQQRPRPVLLPPGVQAQSGRTILVDSEEPMVANLLRRHLRGYQVRGVPRERLQEAVETHLPHAVIRNGLVATAPTHDTPACSTPGEEPLAVPVVTCPLPDPACIGQALGVDHYLVKPATRERLLSLLTAYGDTVRRVLIIEDDAQLAELMGRIVRAAPGPHAVEVACGGEEGWQRMQEWAPDLVLLDLVMEGLDGLAILKLMRADERLRHVRVLVVTAHDLPSADSRLPGRSSISLQGAENLTVTDVLNSLQAILDSLPPPRPATSLPARPGADRPAPPAS